MKVFLACFILTFVLLPSVASAADWYVRPAGGNYGSENGVDYANAWDGLGNVVWGAGGVAAGDTLYVCGTHLMELMVNRSDQGNIYVVSGIDNSRHTVIRGDCPGDPGIVWGSYIPKYGAWKYEGDNTYSISLAGGTYPGIIFEDIVGSTGTLLARAYSLQECKSTPGTFYSDDYVGWSRIYVHTTDNGDPTDRVALNRYGYEFQIPQNGGYITFRNITINSMSSWINSFGYGDNVSYVKFDGCTLGYYDNVVIRTGGSENHHIEITNSVIEYGQEGIAFNAGTHSNTVSGNTIRYMGYLPEHQGGTDPHGIGLMGGTSNNIIENNEIYECEDGIVFYAYDGQNAINNIVRYNYIHDLHGLGGHDVGGGISFGAPGLVTLGDTYGNKVHHNIVCDGNVGVYYKWPDPLEAYNNVFCNNIVNIRAGQTQSDGRGPAIMVRNTISLNPGTYHFEFMTLANEGDYILDSDYNIFYPNSGDNFHIRDAVFEDYYTLSEWQSLSKPGCTFDPNSLTLDPLFENPSAGNFHLQASSPAIDSGTDVGLIVDYEGSPIVGVPDIGAFEYQGTGNVWYVRPAGGIYGNEDGSSYSNAWDGLGSVVWGSGGVQAGDTLYVCGLHLFEKTALVTGPDREINMIGGSAGNVITIRGDCPGDKGVIWGGALMKHEPWVFEGNDTWSITTPAIQNSQVWYFQDVTPNSHTVLDKASSLAECKNTPGTHYSPDYRNPSKLYVHLADNGDPTGRVTENTLGWQFNMHDLSYIAWQDLEFYIPKVLFAYNPPTNFISHITWKDCRIWYGDAILMLFRQGCDYLTFDGCDIAWAQNGLAFAESPTGDGTQTPHHTTVRNSVFHDIAVKVPDGDGHAVSFQGGHDNIIEGSEFYNCAETIAFYSYPNQRIWNNTVRYNYVHDNHNSGGLSPGRGICFNIGSGSPQNDNNKIYGNIVANLVNTGIRVTWSYATYIYNNIVYNSSGQYGNYWITNTNEKIEVYFKNCISLYPSTMHIRVRTGATEGNYVFEGDNNLYYPISGNQFRLIDGDGLYYDMTFAEWQALSRSGCTFDPNSITENPLLVNPSAGNFRLQAGSPAIDSGTDVGLTMDFDGNPIVGIPDIGAFEYSDCGPVEGDLNGDCSVTILDLAMIALDFGRRSGFDIRADTNLDNEIDIYDLVFVASRFT